MASLTCRERNWPVNRQIDMHVQRICRPLSETGDSLLVRRGRRLPAQHTQNQIKHEKGAEDHETDKVHPWKLKAHCVIHLEGPRMPAEEEEEQREERRRNRVKKTLS